MDLFTHLWLPILASAAAVWVASSIGWMFIHHHAKDWNPLPNEAAGLDAIRNLKLAPGVYGFPHMGHKECSTPEGKAKVEKGPMGTMRIWSMGNMGANMVLTFLVYIVVSILVGYLGWAALPHAGAPFSKVFQVLGTAGVLAYCFASLPGDIWFQQSRRAMLMNFIDGIIFGLITGAVFAAFWPKAM